MAIKENSADILQREKLEREKKLAPKSRICDVLLTILFCLFIGGFTLSHIITPDRDYSERENRVLQNLPEFTFESLFSGDYTSDMTKYLSDQFPARDLFVSVKASSERIAMRMENGGIIFGDNSLTARLDHPNLENLDVNITSADKFASAIEKEGISCIFAPAPRRVDVCIDDLPSSFGERSQNELWNTIDSYADSFSGTFVSGLRGRLNARNSLGEDVYYRTDHHWTSLGAYYAYDLLYSTLPDDIADPMSKPRLQDFKKETVTNEFYGTSYSSSGASWVTPDSIDLYRFEGDDIIPVTVVDNGEKYEGLYRKEFLEVRDKYSVFLGENAGRVDIGYGNRPTIMVIKDSFAQSLVPFFAVNYDIVMIDPRYYSDSIYRTVIEEKPDVVMILMNADTLTSSPVLRPLIRGVK